MRPTKRQQEVIRQATKEVFGREASVRLFGSRLDNDKKGGDIDLLIECPEPIKNAGANASLVSAKVQMRLGQQKIDVLYYWPGMPCSLVHRVALDQGVEL